LDCRFIEDPSAFSSLTHPAWLPTITFRRSRNQRESMVWVGCGLQDTAEDLVRKGHGKAP
jgi:hypothetical protein